MLRYLERGLLILATLALLKFGIAYSHRWNSEHTVASFKQQRALDIHQAQSATRTKPHINTSTPDAHAEIRATRKLGSAQPDMALWSPQRKRAFVDAGMNTPSLVAAIEIPSVGVAAPIYQGTDHPQLDRGAGWILGTAALDSTRGNIGIAAHRDGFFRGLKDIKVGDEIELATLTEDRRYRVVELSIVQPEDVHVLASTQAAELTLVTCYPFYFVGKAPQRFIVNAKLIKRTQLDSNGS
ncbi:hypothetical protein GCM10008090_25650 [Arenicella chitinivorans]|uniref:Class D sortase n=1 Tax=Arenicella chitinivorans TaxID=1329800 RepID=A0A918RZF7_9GAMM|nr:class D sortase [Arenicella chitinivorans]GHA14714.1 hypothetical protein GCM10008090_25650 [Arenicella chitinivorans]